jgi:uncharacterized protein YceK
MTSFFIAAGAFLMAGCGSVLARKMGLEGIEIAWVAGFAVGVVMLGQYPAIALRKRVEILEALIARTPAKNAE